MNPPRRLPAAGALAPAAIALVLATTPAGAQTSAGGASSPPGAPAQRQPAAPSPEQRRQAGQAFDAGLVARGSRDFVTAASLFETADRLAPSPQALGNAIEAHRSARTPAHDARAATLALRMLARHGDSARLAAYATGVVRALSPSLERVRVDCSGCDLEVDQALSSDSEFFLEPGHHTIVAHWSNDRVASHEFEAQAGGTEEVTLTPPPANVPTLPATPEGGAGAGAGLPPGEDELPPGMRRPGSGPPPDESREPERGGLPPAVFITGVVLTAGLGAALAWSGLDAVSGVPAYERNPTPEALADGQARELRTNVLIGATAAVGALTLGALVFTRWGGGRVEAAPTVAGAAGYAPGMTVGGRF